MRFLLVLLLMLTGCGDHPDLANKALTDDLGIGRVVGRHEQLAYLIDLASVYRPEQGATLFILGSGRNFKDRKLWLVEGDCSVPSGKVTEGIFGQERDARFVRGVGAEAFQPWPLEILRSALDLGCTTAEIKGGLKHPLSELRGKKERADFLYSPQMQPGKLVLAVLFWSESREKR